MVMRQFTVRAYVKAGHIVNVLAYVSNTWFTRLRINHLCTLFEQISIVTELKEDVKSLKAKFSKSLQNMEAESPNPPIPSTAGPDLDKIYSQLTQLSNSVQNHQKALIEKRESR